MGGVEGKPGVSAWLSVGGDKMDDENIWINGLQNEAGDQEMMVIPKG